MRRLSTFVGSAGGFRCLRPATRKHPLNDYYFNIINTINIIIIILFFSILFFCIFSYYFFLIIIIFFYYFIFFIEYIIIIIIIIIISSPKSRQKRNNGVGLRSVVRGPSFHQGPKPEIAVGPV